MTLQPADLQRASYEKKPVDYYSNARHDYVALLPINQHAAVLELGCGDGATGALAFEKGKCGRYIGIEMFEPMAAKARRVLTDVHVGNVESMELPYAPASFDALIMSEVLEHLVDPQTVLSRLAALVRPGGLVLASSPNIGHWRNIKNLAVGKFEYTDSGMMDRTHLRWFTPTSFARMFESAGVTVDRVAPFNTLSMPAKIVRAVMGRKFDALWYSQINLHGHRRA